jgi:peptide deformylase
MALRIAQLGQPVLRQKAVEVAAEEISAPRFQQLVRDMIATMRAVGGIGLAGPQVFESKRVFVAAILPPAREDDPPGVEVFINPKLTPTSTDIGYAWEGCLSFIELLTLVPRHKAVRIEYLNAQGEPRTLDLEGFPARVVQHEHDHLEGILTIDRAPSTRYIVKASEIEAVLGEEKRTTEAQRTQSEETQRE